MNSDVNDVAQCDAWECQTTYQVLLHYSQRGERSDLERLKGDRYVNDNTTFHYN
jgi:hypothetical protein